MMGRAYILFTPELLAAALHLPDETEIYGAEWDFGLNGVKLYVAHPDIRETPEGARILQTSYSVDEDDVAKFDGNTG